MRHQGAFRREEHYGVLLQPSRDLVLLASSPKLTSGNAVVQGFPRCASDSVLQRHCCEAQLVGRPQRFHAADRFAQLVELEAQRGASGGPT